MLRKLQGNTHSVFTGVTVICKEQGQEICRTFSRETKVHVYPMTEAETEKYLDTGEPMDKAGAYGIQGAFAAWVESIEGDYNNVVGLPVSALWQILKEYVTV
jgi:septum formation protein